MVICIQFVQVKLINNLDGGERGFGVLFIGEQLLVFYGCLGRGSYFGWEKLLFIDYLCFNGWFYKNVYESFIWVQWVN